MSTFSYAQAAKGQTPAVASPTAPHVNGVSANHDDSAQLESAADGATMPAPSSETKTTATEPSEGQRDAAAATSDVDAHVTEDAPQPRRNPSSARSSTGNSQANMSTVSESTSADCELTNGQEPGPMLLPATLGKDNAGKSSEPEIASESDAGKEAQDLKEAAPRRELSEAPIPPVNIWQQRREAQAAKGKQQPKQQAKVDAAAAATDQAKPEQAKPNQAGNARPAEQARASRSFADAEATSASGPTAQPSGTRPPRRGAEQARADGDGSRRPSGRGGRPSEKEAGAASEPSPPPVQDASMWPTPETAIKEDSKAKKKPVEKGEKPGKDANEDAAPSAKSRTSQKWTKMDYTPTVTFQTPIPPMRGTRGGRGGGRGGRDSAAHGPRGPAHAANGGGAAEKPSMNGSSRTGLKADNASRGREGAANESATSIQTPSHKRASIDGAAPRENRRPVSSSVDRAKDGQPVNGLPTSVHGRERPEGRGRGNARGRGATSGNGHGHQGHQGQQGQANLMGQPGFGATTGQTPPSFPSRPQGAMNPGSRSHMPPYGAHPSHFPTRGRGGSMRGGMGGPPAGASGRGHMPSNGPFFRMPSAYMAGPVPYDSVPGPMQYPTPPAVSWAGVASAQIRYYFSEQNLIRDVYLRKHMDSKGFVSPLVIHKFNRIQEMNLSLDQLRQICLEASDWVEYVRGEDGSEYLRSKEGWEKFVLPMDQRFADAMHDGPNSFAPMTRHHINGGYGAAVNGIAGGMSGGMSGGMGVPEFPGALYGHDLDQGYGINNMDHGQAAYVNGRHHSSHGPVPSTPLSADVPSFSPTGMFQPGMMQYGMARLSGEFGSGFDAVGGAGRQVNGSAYHGHEGGHQHGAGFDYGASENASAPMDANGAQKNGLVNGLGVSHQHEETRERL